MLGPDTFAEFPTRITLPPVSRIVIVSWQPRLDTLRVDKGFASFERTSATEIPGVDFTSSPTSSQNRLPCCRRSSLLELLLCRNTVDRFVSDQSSIRLVDRFPADNGTVLEISGLVDPLREVGASADKVILQVILNILAVDDSLRREIASCKE